ncbi:MAG: winged helix-turn-helix transcriptional regulator [Planctomycetaceae bacterium]|nr:winged helix-turn-helix transcriptional regulator [Planctomycetaceae bacterium]
MSDDLPPVNLIEEFASKCKLLGDSTRLRILLILDNQGDVHVAGLCEQLELNQPAVSHHLSLLRDAGVVKLRKDGKHNYYSYVRKPFIDVIKRAVRTMSHGDNVLRHDGLVVRVIDAKK